ncbi:hypothetical protein KEM48_011028 [Puccinia striiformis f. sp. tritici PST-130]|nr:hypothetical protein KEM48_011028 [Puccinia striiformis f. sp. tritici PST-130]
MNYVNQLKSLGQLISCLFLDFLAGKPEWPTIPQVYIDGEFMGGCDMMMEMHRTGELGRLLESKGVYLNLIQTLLQNEAIRSIAE